MIVIKYFFLDDYTIISIYREDKETERSFKLKKNSETIKILARFITSKKDDFYIEPRFSGQEYMKILMVKKDA